MINRNQSRMIAQERRNKSNQSRTRAPVAKAKKLRAAAPGK